MIYFTLGTDNLTLNVMKDLTEFWGNLWHCTAQYITGNVMKLHVIKKHLTLYFMSGRLDEHWGSALDGIPIWTRNGTTGHRWQQAQIPIYKPTRKTGVRYELCSTAVLLSANRRVYIFKESTL